MHGSDMKKLTLIAVLGLMLSGCTISILPGSGGNGGSTSISNLGFSSNYQDSSGKSYVCDNYTTQLTYTFQYTGSLSSWRSSLVGKQSGQTAGTADFYLNSPGVNAAGNLVSVTYNVPPNAAPLSVPNTGIKPQSIIVVPNIKGYTDLKLTFYDSNGNAGTVRLNSDIPVQDC